MQQCKEANFSISHLDALIAVFHHDASVFVDGIHVVRQRHHEQVAEPILFPFVSIAIYNGSRTSYHVRIHDGVRLKYSNHREGSISFSILGTRKRFSQSVTGITCLKSASDGRCCILRLCEHCAVIFKRCNLRKNMDATRTVRSWVRLEHAMSRVAK